MADAEVSDWSTNAAGNANQTGMPMNEGMEPAQLNDSIRGIMAAVRRAWINVTDLSNLSPAQIAAWIATLGVAKNNLSNVDPATGRAALGVVNAAAQSLFATGDVKTSMNSNVPTGWVRLDGSTVGNAVSNATGRANADASALFTMLWNENAALVIYDSTGAVVSRGVNAASDFALNKALATPNASGEFLRIIDLTGVVDGVRSGGNLQGQQLQTHNHASGEAFTTGSARPAVYGDTSTSAPGTFPGAATVHTDANTGTRQPYTSAGSPAAGAGSGAPVGTFGTETRPVNMAIYAYIAL